MSWAPGRAAADAAAKAWLRDQQLPPLATPPPVKRKSNDPVYGPHSLAPQRAPGYNTPRLTAQQTKLVASSLLSELRRTPPPSPQEPPPAWRTISSKKLADARLLLLLAKGDAPQKISRNRCGKCDECLSDDCGKCPSCLDKRKFGGSGVRKQACSARRCTYMAEKQKENASWGC